MEWAAIQAMIPPELASVLAVCWVAGYVLKRTPWVPDWSIVYVVTAVAILMTCLLLGPTAESVIQGILCGAVSVYGHQLVRQTSKAVNGEGGGDGQQ